MVEYSVLDSLYIENSEEFWNSLEKNYEKNDSFLKIILSILMTKKLSIGGIYVETAIKVLNMLSKGAKTINEKSGRKIDFLEILKIQNLEWENQNKEGIKLKEVIV